MEYRREILRLHTERLGSVKQVTDLLNDIENAYNHLYAFDIHFEILKSYYNRNKEFQNERNKIYDQYRSDFSKTKRYTSLEFEYRLMKLEEFEFLNDPNNLRNIFENYRNKPIESLILPEHRLILNKVNIQSPGFWEFLGALNPLEQIRKFLNDLHERKKDKDFRNRQEEQMGEMEIQKKYNEIIKERIELLRNVGYSEEEIKLYLSEQLDKPLGKLIKYSDNLQIENAE